MLHRHVLRRFRLGSLVVLSPAMVIGCGVSRSAAGGPCKGDDNCGEGLVCVVDTCRDGLELTKGRAEKLGIRVETYMSAHEGECPSDDEYKDEASAKDAWHRPFKVICPGTRRLVEVISSGPDGKHDTVDDISNIADNAETPAAQPMP